MIGREPQRSGVIVAIVAAVIGGVAFAAWDSTEIARRSECRELAAQVSADVAELERRVQPPADVTWAEVLGEWLRERAQAYRGQAAGSILAARLGWDLDGLGSALPVAWSHADPKEARHAAEQVRTHLGEVRRDFAQIVEACAR